MMQDLFTYKPYPLTPGHRGVETSVQAAESMTSKKDTLQAAVIEKLRDGDYTADEVAELLGESVLSIRPRFSELRLSNRIVDSGLRRKNASGRNSIVWRLV